jgi:hypothetical protein
LALALIAPIFFWTPIGWLTNCLHLGLMISMGVGVLNNESRGQLIAVDVRAMRRALITDNQRFAVYDWSVGLAGGPDRFVFYDLTDEIALPLAQHRGPPSDEEGWGEECAGRVTHLLGHYYICTVG